MLTTVPTVFSGERLEINLVAWREKPVMLRFHLNGAELYPYAFRPAANT